MSHGPFDNLTAREAEVARGLALGQKNAEIAKDLGISVKTIDTHRAHVLAKVKARNNVELCLEALRRGFIDISDRA